MTSGIELRVILLRADFFLSSSFWNSDPLNEYHLHTARSHVPLCVNLCVTHLWFYIFHVNLLLGRDSAIGRTKMFTQQFNQFVLFSVVFSLWRRGISCIRESSHPNSFFTLFDFNECMGTQYEM